MLTNIKIIFSIFAIVNKKNFIQVVLPLPLEWEPFYALPEGSCAQVGDRVTVPFSGKELQAVVTSVGCHPSLDPAKIREIIRFERDIPSVTEGEIRLWRFISQYYMCTLGEVFLAAYPSSRRKDEQTAARLREALQARQLREEASSAKRAERLRQRISLRQEKLAAARKDSVKERLNAEIELLRTQLAALDTAPAPCPEEAPTALGKTSSGEGITLSPAQQKAAGKALKAFSEGRDVLLEGVTGSGKTQVYLYLADKVLGSGKNVLYLAPEIAMGLQLSSRIGNAFPEYFHSYSSGASATARRAATELVSSGRYLLLGTRSAIFLPHNNLGLIIIDEEHDSSYKQDSPAPRYNGRDCALVLARMAGCPVILGSATPSLESLYNCRTGKYEHITLNEKYYGSGRSDLEIIDTVAERRKNGMRGSFSLKLIDAVNSALSCGGQVMIIRSRRSYSPAVQCESCGEIVKCTRCNVALSYHADRNALICHYCGHSEPFTGKCPRCRGRLVPLGAGTQKIAEEAQALFPGARIARLEGDASPLQAQKTVRDFYEGRTDIMVGTQILAKGFDFPGVTLTAMIQADSLLSMDDFRADEKALQLLSQLRGRSGRRGGDCRFIVQTSNPGHPVYRTLEGKDAFVEQSFRERKDFAYPPFTREIVLILRDSDQARLKAMSVSLAASLSAPGAAVTGPYSPPVDKVAGRYISHIRLTLPRDASLKASKARIASEISDFCKAHSWNGHVSIDVDPA